MDNVRDLDKVIELEIAAELVDAAGSCDGWTSVYDELMDTAQSNAIAERDREPRVEYVALTDCYNYIARAFQTQDAGAAYYLKELADEYVA